MFSLLLLEQCTYLPIREAFWLRIAAMSEAKTFDVHGEEAAQAAITSNSQIAFRRGPAKKRKYRDDHKYTDITVKPHLCIKGGRLNKFVALPTETIEDEPFVRVGAKEVWLCELMAGRVVTKELCSAVSKVKAYLRDLLGTQIAKEAEEDLQAATAGRSAMGLDALDLGDSSDEDRAAGSGAADSGSDLTEHSPSKRPKPRRGRRAKELVQQLTLHGEEMKVSFKEKRFYIEARARAIEVFVKQLTVEMVPLPLRMARARLAQRPSLRRAGSGSDSVSTAPETADSGSGQSISGRVVLIGDRYYVHYQRSDGTRSTYTKGLRVPSKTAMGEPMAEKEYASALEAVRVAAVRAWNELDMSDRPRLACH